MGLVLGVAIVLVIAFLLVEYSGYFDTDREIPPLEPDKVAQLASYQAMPEESQLAIAPDNEPGERLWLCLRFVDKATQDALAGRSVHFYHTSAAGEYEPADPADESTARLSGSAMTDDAGRIYVRTVLPGDYGSADDNRHIHMAVRGAKPEAYDIHFSQFSTFMLRDFVAGSDQHFLAFLQQHEGNELVSFVTVEIKLPDE